MWHPTTVADNLWNLSKWGFLEPPLFDCPPPKSLVWIRHCYKLLLLKLLSAKQTPMLIKLHKRKNHTPVSCTTQSINTDVLYMFWRFPLWCYKICFLPPDSEVSYSPRPSTTEHERRTLHTVCLKESLGLLAFWTTCFNRIRRSFHSATCLSNNKRLGVSKK